ncbi:hypothetical protein BDL97_13G073500 [Sphagnum fallax]|nr:hypothetical protein BDL97_13G073500 [Sphagnum fallax]
MFLYLSKKISMPNGIKLCSLTWNSEQGWLACGGELGLLKVLKLETGAAVEGPCATAPSNLSMNQTLEGHHGMVLAVSWNQNYRKLTSSDEQGLIIVWVLHKGMWFEEMINTRESSVVRDLRWSCDGQKICIVYEDGQVLVGNVDGNRLWGKELNIQLAFVEWSPDSQFILFCTTEGTCQIHDFNGNFVAQLCMHFGVKGSTTPDIVGIDWYNGLEGHIDPGAPTLALAFLNGKLQLMRHELDEESILLDSRMANSCIKWSPDGGVLAVAGSTQRDTPSSMVQLYSSSGNHLRTLQIPGTRISAVSWEGGGLRLALAVDAYIYLANIRPEYKWAFSGNSTCVYEFKKKDRGEHSVMFWDIRTCERNCKYVNHLVAVCGGGQHSVLATLC